MAKRRGGRGGGSGGAGKFFGTVLSLVIVGVVVFSFAKANNINSVESLFSWSKTSSEKVRGCLKPNIDFWQCNPFEGGGEPSGGNGGGSGSGGDDSSGASDGSTDGNGGDSSKALEQLAALKISKGEKVSYDRKEWKHWIGDRCNDTRQQVLKEQAVSYKLDAQSCRVASGEWIDLYTGAKITDPSKIDIDHVYPLEPAARFGGQNWSAAQKEKFANDKSNLIAASASANRSKGPKTPSEWLVPDNAAGVCKYSTVYVATASKYGLAISDADRKALEKGLKQC